MSNSSTIEENPDVVKIAAEILEAEPKNVPLVLQQLKDILDSLENDRTQIKIAQQTIWKYDLLNWCVSCLSPDYNLVKEQFELLRSIVNILYECCYVVNIEESEEFSTSSLPLAVTSCLSIIRQLAAYRKEGNLPMELHLLKSDLLRHLYKIVAHYPHLVAKNIIQSKDLLRIIMEHERDVNLSIKVIKIAHRAVEVDRTSVTSQSSHVEALLDELVYKMTSSGDEQVAVTSLRLILAVAKQHKHFEDLMKKRYKGLKAILGRWEDRGMNDELRKIIQILEPPQMGDPLHEDKLQIEKCDAATTIWAYYQGYKTRRRMKALRRVIPKLQKIFRTRLKEREMEENLVDNTREENGVKEKRMRNERRMHLLEIIPADKIDEHLNEERESAATKIQAGWRAHVTRSNYDVTKINLKRRKAAVVIQKAVRLFLSRIEKKKQKKFEESKFVCPIMSSEISKDRRKEIEVEIMQWQAIHKRFGVSDEEVVENHVRAQQLVTSYYNKRVAEEERNLKIKTLLAKIRTQQDIVQNLPSICECNEPIRSLYSSSSSVQFLARTNHNAKIKRMTMPWWKNLNQDHGDQDLSIDL